MSPRETAVDNKSAQRAQGLGEPLNFYNLVTKNERVA